MKLFLPWATFVFYFAMLPIFADGPADNNAATVRPIPPPGIELSEEVEKELQSSVQKLRVQLKQLGQLEHLAADQLKQELCEVIPRAVQITLDTGMFYSDKEIEQARELLELGESRLSALERGATALEILGVPKSDQPLAQPLPVAGGFRSRIDDSVQPYGLILPAGMDLKKSKSLRLDVWLHGRGEKTSEVVFLQQRRKQLGEYTPSDTVVLHPYGRYSNAFKFAGEIDVLEAIEHVKKLLPIDNTRIAIRGFSMGGAGCWQLAVHYPNLWAAANPGAGFSETTEFLRVFQQEVIQPTDTQQRLLHWYDCPDWTNNLRHVPTVAYSGEKDRQKQAADVMVAAYEARGMTLPHIIGPDTEHKIHADSKIEVQALLDVALDAGKNVLPRSIDLTTFMLRYHQLGWLSIEGLEEHWHESRVQAKWREEQAEIELTTTGITKLALQFPADVKSAVSQILVDGQALQVAEIWKSPQNRLTLQKSGAGSWSVNEEKPSIPTSDLAKTPGMQGPIDDAFMDRFVIMPPETNQTALAIDDWVWRECGHAQSEWRRQMRGEVPLHDYQSRQAVNLDQNLVLFGRPATNRMLATIVKQLPIQWTDDELVVDGEHYDAKTHVPALIYPNPLNPQRYVVINSGFTYREYAYLNNARQVPMLPDWAVIDVRGGATSQLPGKISAAGFFDEHWQFHNK